MWPSVYRATRAVPRTLDDLRPRRAGARRAYRCSMRGCRKCAEFETEGRSAYEDALRAKGMTVVDWDCSERQRTHRRLAEEAGVDDLPAYFVLTSERGAPAEVLQPP